jgi:hypothetical protein
MVLASVRRGLRAGFSGRDEMVMVMMLAQSKSGIGVVQNNSTFLDSELGSFFLDWKDRNQRVGY